MNNTITIEADQLHINEKQKITSHWLRFMFVVLAIQAGGFWVKYFRNHENYYLFIAIFITLIVGIFVIREIFFRTNKNIIALSEIRKVSIQKILFDKEKVYLNIKLKRKTRVILVEKSEASEILNRIESGNPRPGTTQIQDL